MIFTLIRLKQTLFLGYTALQLFCTYNICTCNAISLDNRFALYISNSRSMCAVPIVAVFCNSLQPNSAFPVCCSGTVWVILKWFHSPLLLPVSLLLFTFYMCCISVLMSLYFRMFSASWSHSCLLKWWHLLAYTFTFYHHHHHHHHHGGIGNVYRSEGSQTVPACPSGKV